MEKSSDVCSNCIKLVDLNAQIDFFVIKNSCSFSCNLTGWEVKDDANHFFELLDLRVGESRQYKSDKEVWNDNGDRFFMRDKEGRLVVFYEYT